MASARIQLRVYSPFKFVSWLHLSVFVDWSVIVSPGTCVFLACDSVCMYSVCECVSWAFNMFVNVDWWTYSVLPAGCPWVALCICACAHSPRAVGSVL